MKCFYLFTPALQRQNGWKPTFSLFSSLVGDNCVTISTRGLMPLPCSHTLVLIVWAAKRLLLVSKIFAIIGHRALHFSAFK